MMKKTTKILLGLTIIGIGIYVFYKLKNTDTSVSGGTDTGGTDTGGTDTGGTDTGGIDTGSITDTGNTGGTQTGGTTQTGTQTGGGMIYEPVLPTNNLPSDANPTDLVRARIECLRAGNRWVVTSGGGYCSRVNAPMPKPVVLNQGIVQGITSATITPVWTPQTNPRLGTACFVEGTLITLNNYYYSKLPIEEIKIGQRVLSFDIETGKKEESVVHNILQKKVTEIMQINTHNKTIKCTREHPFFVDGEWVEAERLEVGDLLQLESGRKVKIKSVKHLNEEHIVYNISVYNNRNYYANGILVHNKDTYTGQQAQNVLTQLQQIFSPYNVYNSQTPYTTYNSINNSYNSNY